MFVTEGGGLLGRCVYIKARGLLAVKSEQFSGNTKGKKVPLGFERVTNHSAFDVNCAFGDPGI